jgi:hypothetical protein
MPIHVSRPAAETSDGSKAPNPRKPTILLLLLIVLANLVLLALTWGSGSWFAAAIAVTLVPELNVLLAVISLLATFWLRRRPRFPTAWHVALSLLVPALLAGIDFWVIVHLIPDHG